MDKRQERGLVIAALAKINRKNGLWVVPSQTSPEKTYLVNPEAGTCTCPDCQESGFKCKHQYAVEFTIKREYGADGSVTETRTMTFSEKKVYRQSWPEYNAAQVHEKEHFQALLFDLCRNLKDIPRDGPGRKPIPASDAIFACAYKVYSTVSTRRFMTDLKEAQTKGFLAGSIHYNSICAFLENPRLTPILKELIAKSALPLKAVEVDFAVDSTGFSSSRFVRWFDEKYGTERSGHDWVKAHFICGIKTNVVTSVEIKGRDAHDAPMFGPLVKNTRRNFSIREVSADKAYLSQGNIDTVFEQGGTPFIAFKVNSTGAVGGLFEKMFHYFQFNRQDYLDHYHKRSNVESTVSMIKAKFRDHVRSRSDTAMVNEVLCKVLCHNLCCLISAMYELGIKPVFQD